MATNKIPVLPLRDIVVFPHMVVPLFVGRDKSVQALESVMKEDKNIMIITQKSASIDDPKKNDLFFKILFILSIFLSYFSKISIKLIK